MPRHDYYHILGVERSADAEAIKRAWRTVARQWHPDRNPDDPDAARRFKDAQEAWRTLSDPEKRQRYDQLGMLYTEDGRPPRPDEVSEVVGSLLGNLFKRRPARGRDLAARVDISLADVMKGATPSLSVTRKRVCNPCGGVGTLPENRRRCATCAGTGRSTRARLLRSACWHCNGRGWTAVQVCSACAGEGLCATPETLRVQVPPGVADGQKLRVGERGDEAPGATPGDLFVSVHIAPHPTLERRGDDLVLRVPVRFRELVLGARFELPSLDGPLAVALPPRAAAGHTASLTGRGLPRAQRSGRGDLHVSFELEVPTRLTEASEKALDSWFDALPPDAHPRRQRFDAAAKERP